MIMARSGSTQKKKKDGSVSTLTRAVSIHCGGGPCRKVELEEVDLCPVEGPKDPDGKEISKAGIGGAYVFSYGSLQEDGNVGGGAFVVGTDGLEDSEVECGVGDAGRLKGSHRGAREGR